MSRWRSVKLALPHHPVELGVELPRCPLGHAEAAGDRPHHARKLARADEDEGDEGDEQELLHRDAHHGRASRVVAGSGPSPWRRPRQSPRKRRIGAAMKIDEVVAITTPKSIGIAKEATAGPPQSASGSMASAVVAEV
jgi:hypothetical protein